MPALKTTTVTDRIEASFCSLEASERIIMLRVLTALDRNLRQGIGQSAAEKRAKKDPAKEPGQQPIELQDAKNAATGEGL